MTRTSLRHTPVHGRCQIVQAPASSCATSGGRFRTLEFQDVAKSPSDREFRGVRPRNDDLPSCSSALGEARLRVNPFDRGRARWQRKQLPERTWGCRKRLSHGRSCRHEAARGEYFSHGPTTKPHAKKRNGYEATRCRHHLDALGKQDASRDAVIHDANTSSIRGNNNGQPSCPTMNLFDHPPFRRSSRSRPS